MSAVVKLSAVECESSLAGWIRRRVVPLWTTSPRPFWSLWSFIGLVSVFDAWLVYHYLEAIPYMERNPLCYFLIMLDCEHLSVFLPAKAVGTLAVLLILRLIFLLRRDYSLPITSGVAAYQAGLVVYLVAI